MRLVSARRLAIAGTALFAAVLLAGCGGNDHSGANHDDESPTVSTSASGATFNDTDVRFAADMITHHRQAITMAQAAATRASDPRVKELAGRIEAAQDPEISTMSGWLNGWKQPVPSAEAGMPNMSGMDHGGHMPGMMSDQEMSGLMAAKGAAFDKLFLQLMIRHHQGAIEMAGTAQAQGQDPQAKQLAAKIAADQRAEIAKMQAILAKLP